jgi:hypothetical protein
LGKRKTGFDGYSMKFDGYSTEFDVYSIGFDVQSTKFDDERWSGMSVKARTGPVA